MLKPHWKPDNDLLKPAIRELRNDVAPDPDVANVLRAMETSKPIIKSRDTWRPVAAALTVALASGLILWPKETPASALMRAMEAEKPQWRSERSFERLADGKYRLVKQVFVGNDRWRAVQSDGVQLVGDRVSTTTYYPEWRFASVEASTRQVGVVSKGTGLLLLEETEESKVERVLGSTLEGKVAYKVKDKVVDANGQKVTFEATVVVDDASGLPLKVEGHYQPEAKVVFGAKIQGSGQTLKGKVTGFVHTWEYRKNGPESLTLEMPVGTPIYHYAQQRKEALQQVLTPIATDTVGGRRVELRGLYLDHQNTLTAIITGSSGWFEEEPQVLAIDGAPTGNPIKFALMKGAYRGDRFFWEPIGHKGLNLVAISTKFPESVDITSEFWITVPVHNEAGNLLGRARFFVEHPVKTGLTPMMLAPDNRSIFIDEPVRPESPITATGRRLR